MRFLARLKRLEQSKDAGSCGPCCPPVWIDSGDDWYGDPCPTEQAAPCPGCGRPATTIRLVQDSNIYGNADRLRAVAT